MMDQHERIEKYQTSNGNSTYISIDIAHSENPSLREREPHIDKKWRYYLISKYYIDKDACVDLIQRLNQLPLLIFLAIQISKYLKKK